MSEQKQYVVDKSSNSIMPEQQERVNTTVRVFGTLTVFTILTLLVMSFFPCRRPSLANTREAVASLLEQDFLVEAGRRADEAKRILKKNRKQAMKLARQAKKYMR